MKVRSLSRLLLIVLWLLTFLSAVIWAFVDEPPFDPEPVTVLLGLVSGAITGVLQEYGKTLDEEEYSISYALAYGYVNNFVEPVITQVLSSNETPLLYIYIPERLAELEPANVDRVMAAIRKKFRSDLMQLGMKEGRARDIIVIMKSEGQAEKMLFDFPNTLLTLNSLVDFKVESKKGSFSSREKEALGKKYIEKFQTTVRSMVTQKGLEGYVRFTDKNMSM